MACLSVCLLSCDRILKRIMEPLKNNEDRGANPLLIESWPVCLSAFILHYGAYMQYVHRGSCLPF